MLTPIFKLAAMPSKLYTLNN